MFFTDDTVMIIAIAEGLMNGGSEGNFIETMKKYGRLYPDAGYGCNFIYCIFSDSTSQYNSFGNGSAMRVSPVAWFFDNLENVENYAEISSSVTHNHAEGIKGAKATASCIFLARSRNSKDEIKSYIEEKHRYNLNRSLNEVRENYYFNESCQETVPEAIIAFLESIDFEDAIRNAISLGGDSDTLAAICGSIAEGTYGIPEEIRTIALSKLEKPLLDLYKTFYEKASKVYEQNGD